MRALALLSLLLLVACGLTQPQVPLDRFAAGDLGVVADFARKEATEGPVENQALLFNVLAQCELLQGDVDAAWQHFGAAARIMGNWQTSGSETFSAVVGSESSKGYTGDPYEKAMNAFYLGMCYLLKGEADNARAAFKKGILADGESGDEKYQADFTLLFWLAGRMSRAMGLPADAEDFFKEAVTADAFARTHGSRGDSDNPLLTSPAAGNLVILAEIGMGPEKYAAGDEEELARFRPRWHAAYRAQVWIDDELRGPTYMLVDVDYQARTRGGTEMEGIRKGKAVLKSVTRAAGVGALILAAGDDSRQGSRDKALVGAGLLVLSALTSSSADIRHWPTLPSTVQGAAFEVAPGDHVVRIDFLSSSGSILTDLTQTWTVNVPPDGESYYLFRSMPRMDRIPRSQS
ncbi:MAG: hypothetical protein ABL997_15830 [Planctomycetota bacterium]